MKLRATTFSLKSNGLFYGIAVLLLIIGLTIVSGYFFYQLLPDKNRFALSFTPFVYNEQKGDVFIFHPLATDAYLEKNGMSSKNYTANIIRLQKRLESIGFSTKIIREAELAEISPHSLLIVPDATSLTGESIQTIENYLNKGGNLVANYHFGYYQTNRYVGPSTIEKITHLNFRDNFSLHHKSGFYVPKNLSPLQAVRSFDLRQNLVMYGQDTLPLFQSTHIPDLVLTNWGITSTPKLENGTTLPIKQAGLAWHGFYGKGAWFYFSFPLYAFLDMPDEIFANIMKSIYRASFEPLTLVMYPFIDTRNAIFISEDTEYKYQNMIDFVQVAKTTDMPVTLFCVAKLAQEFTALTKEAASFTNVEIGSHSYSHKTEKNPTDAFLEREIVESREILQEITDQPVYGFRPPKEEIDERMEKWLAKAGYRYVMEKTKAYTLPKKTPEGLITIPRHGTDDYLYLIRLFWNHEKILKNIQDETEFLTAIDGIFTLSIHTHLLGYPKNLPVLQKYFDYLHSRPILHPMKGETIAQKTNQRLNIGIRRKIYGSKMLFFISNNNDETVKNLTFRVYWPHTQIQSIVSERVGVNISILTKKPEERYTDIRVDRLRGHTELTLIMTLKPL